MLQPKDTELITEEDYLQGELTSDVKHELIDGCVYAMAGASANHERIAGNVYRKFGNHLEGSSCEPFGSDMKVKVGANFFYPDVTVDCDFDRAGFCRYPSHSAE
jgi:Uma2 family endonuclease